MASSSMAALRSGDKLVLCRWCYFENAPSTVNYVCLAWRRDYKRPYVRYGESCRPDSSSLQDPSLRKLNISLLQERIGSRAIESEREIIRKFSGKFIFFSKVKYLRLLDNLLSLIFGAIFRKKENNQIIYRAHDWLR